MERKTTAISLLEVRSRPTALSLKGQIYNAEKLTLVRRLQLQRQKTPTL
jgi:hypothetical protein